MANMEDKIRDILQTEECTFNESVKRIEELAKENACKAFCRYLCGPNVIWQCPEKPCELLTSFKKEYKEISNA